MKVSAATSSSRRLLRAGFARDVLVGEAVRDTSKPDGDAKRTVGVVVGQRRNEPLDDGVDPCRDELASSGAAVVHEHVHGEAVLEEEVDERADESFVLGADVQVLQRVDELLERAEGLEHGLFEKALLRAEVVEQVGFRVASLARDLLQGGPLVAVRSELDERRLLQEIGRVLAVRRSGPLGLLGFAPGIIWLGLLLAHPESLLTERSDFNRSVRMRAIRTS